MSDWIVRGRLKRTSVIVAALVVVTAAAIAAFPHTKAAIERLTTFFGSPIEHRRNVALRLHGFTWAPYRAEPASHAENRAIPALARMRGSSTNDPHSAAIGELLRGRPRQALAILTRASEAASDALTWNDLAVAWYETAEQYGSAELLADALAAADRALDLDPELDEALFNRAAILQRLGLRDDARIAWEWHLRYESDSAWAGEARKRLGEVQPERSFLDTIDRNPAEVTNLAREHPQDARLSGAIDILSRWAKAANGGNGAAAARNLEIARSLGAALAVKNGDRLLADAVTAIESANTDERRVLAAAHIDLASGHEAYRDNRPVDAEQLLLRAANGFLRARSPLALAARQTAGIMMFEQSRDAEDLRVQEALLREVPDQYIALRAHVRWHIGVVYAAAGRWGDALPLLQESNDTFVRLGELDHSARIERVIALVYDRTGDPATAWKHRMIALRGIGLRSDLALEKSIATIAQAAIFAKKWRVALSFLDLEIDIARRIDDDVQRADALLYRAVVRHETGDSEGARRDATEAEIAVAGLADPAYREYLHADTLVVRARLAESPTVARGLLDDAIRFLGTKGDGMEIPSLYLQRARVARREGDVAAALRDLRRGIAILEAGRESLPQGEARWGAFHTDAELFEEAIELSVQQDDALSALAFNDRARARALLDAYHRPAEFDVRKVPARTAVIALVTLPKQTIVLTAIPAAVRATTLDVARDVIASDVEALTRALRANDLAQARLVGTRLYERLIAPIQQKLGDATSLVFVPDSTTAILPFAALFDRHGESLLEHHAVVVAPSAAAYLAAESQDRATGRPRSVLIASNAEPDESGGLLLHVRAETRAIARCYPRSNELQDTTQLRDPRFGADVLHFSGHAIGDESGLEPASIVLREENTQRRLSVGEIAKLPLEKTSVVVLAGCSTARGERRSAEGVISVAHGFLLARVPSVIATLWPIDDQASAAFFPRLHTLLAGGIPPAEALRTAQLDSIHNGTAPPSMWAALQTMGK